MRDYFIVDVYCCSTCHVEVAYTQFANMEMVESGKCYRHYREDCDNMDA